MKFSFVSETLRELAYEQLTFSIRRSLHRKIGSWYEYTYPDQYQFDAHADIVAHHWEQGNVPDKALRAYFHAALNHERVGNHVKLLETASKARDFLTLEDAERSDELKLMLCRIDILLFKALYHIRGDYKGEQLRNTFAAISYLCNGISWTGNLCTQLAGLGILMFAHTTSVGALSSKEQRMRHKQAHANDLDKNSDLVAALRECFHVLRPVSV